MMATKMALETGAALKAVTDSGTVTAAVFVTTTTRVLTTATCRGLKTHTSGVTTEVAPIGMPATTETEDTKMRTTTAAVMTTAGMKDDGVTIGIGD
jgi:hypothetical protein